MSSKVVISAQNLGKCYPLFDAPLDRLKQMVMPRVQYAIGAQPHRYFREFWALKSVSFEVKQGETVGIIGRNGSGKSTLLQMVCGTLTPTIGQIHTNGRVAALLELGAGFNPEFTGRENIFFNAQILGLSKEEIDSRFNEIVAFADIGDFLDQPVKIYSNGMFVRLAFAVQACVEPDILIVDEALAVGDVAFQAKCLDRIRRLSVRGTTILFVSHDVGSVRTFCDRAIWLDRGSVKLSGSVIPVTSAYLGDVFAGRQKIDAAGADTIVTHCTGTELGRSAKPISHWGTRMGLIRDVGMYSVDGARKLVFDGPETIVVRIRIGIPQDLNHDNLAAAFSIKTLSGLDVVAASLPLERALAVNRYGDFEVEFRFSNILNTAKYMLSAALERRQMLDVVYIEHIDGTYYFQSIQAGLQLGLVVPEINTVASPLHVGQECS